MRHPHLNAQSSRSTLLVAAAFTIALASVSCGRTDIEDSQRAWLDAEHAIEKRIVEAWRTHDELRLSVPADHSRNTIGDSSARQYDYADSVLVMRRRSLDAINALIDRHSLARDNAIRSDDIAAVTKGFDTARADYVRIGKTLDSIANDLDVVERMIGAITFETPLDSVATPSSDGSTGPGAAMPADVARSRDTAPPPDAAPEQPVIK